MSLDTPGNRLAASSPGRSGGFTLIELVVVVVISGILLGIAAVRFAPILARTKVNRAAAILASDLQYAQMQAVRQRTPVVVLANSSLKAYLIRERDTAKVYRERFLGPNTDFALDLFNAAPGDAEFFPNGVTRETTTFTLGLSGHEREVRLTRAGQIRVANVP